MVGEQKEALEMYATALKDVTFKDLKFCSKMARLMVKLDRLS